MRASARAAVVAMALAAACGHASAPAAAPAGAEHATPPTCEAIVAHLAMVFGRHDLAPAERADLVAACDRSNPPVAERTCLMAASIAADVDACGRSLAAAAHAKAVAPAPDDPRDDLLALGGQVYTYWRQLGEGPPAAGPTPAPGTCCAAACPADPAAWTGPWQLVRFSLDHATRFSFSMAPTDDGAATLVRAIGCGTPARTFELRVTGAASPTAADLPPAPAPAPAAPDRRAP